MFLATVSAADCRLGCTVIQRGVGPLYVCMWEERTLKDRVHFSHVNIRSLIAERTRRTTGEDPKQGR